MRYLIIAGLCCAATLPLSSQAQTCTEQKLASPNGPGIKVDRYCNRREGQFRDGMLQGKGIATYANSRVEEGDFARDRLWGIGKVTYQDNRVAEGQFVDGRMSGLGKLTWPDGRFHEGLFYNGSPAGAGRFRSVRGEIYEGTFDSGGQLEGRGVLTLPDGTKTYGQFRNNRPVGEVIVVKADGTESKQMYSMSHQLVRDPTPAVAQPAAQQQANSPDPASSSLPVPAAPGNAAAPEQVIQEVDRAIRGLRGLFGK